MKQTILKSFKVTKKTPIYYNQICKKCGKL